MNLIFLGDSLMQYNDKSTYPQEGWPQELSKYLRDELKIKMFNYAKNGRSTKSFIDEDRFKEALLTIKKGDICFISFGHNDEKEEDPSRYTKADEEYIKNLNYMYDSIKAKGAEVIFLTSVSRLKYKKKELLHTHGEYPRCMKQLAEKLNVICVDLENITYNELVKHDYSYNKRYYMVLEPYEYFNYFQGSNDQTHLNAVGADWISFLVYNSLKDTKYSYIFK